MQNCLRIAAIAALLFISASASAQSAVFNFEDGTDQGFGTGFGNDASASFPITNIGGSLRMSVLDTASFQQAGREEGNPATAFYQAMLAASANEAGYEIAYDWYVDPSLSPGNYGTSLQLGTYVNTGSGYYAQDFPAVKEVELNGAQLAGNTPLSGTVVINMAAAGYNIPLGETFFRLGLITNGNGTNAVVHFDNVTVRPVPEPASLTLLGVPLLALRRRRI
jgi:hypothetical protein